MTDHAEWDFPNTATPPGSAPYYVARFSPPRQRDALARWLAWFAHIDAIAARANDPGVARLKLDWWREEVGHMLGNSARHPLARALSPQVASAWQVEQMQRALHAVEQRILKRQPATLEQFHRQCADQHASRLRLLCDTDDAGLAEHIETMGTYLATIQRLQQLATDLRDDYLSLPADKLAEQQLTAEQLRSAEALPQLAELAQQLIASAGPCDSAYLKSLGRHQALQPALRCAAQSLRLARLMQRQRFALNRRRSELTPLGLLWSARRMR